MRAHLPTHTKNIAVAFIALVVIIAAPQAWAACSNPAGTKGDIVYNDDFDMMQYCDDTNWTAMGAQNATPVNDGEWVEISGSSSSFGAGLGEMVTLDESTDTIAYVDQGTRVLSTHQWNGSSWSSVGSGLLIGGLSLVGIAALDSSTVALVDSGNALLQTYRWNGSNWTKISTDLSIATIGFPQLEALDTNTVAFFDANNDEVRTYDWDGTTWAQIGNSYSIASAGEGSMAKLNNTTIAFTDGGTTQLRTLEWDGTDWSQVGNALTLTGLSNNVEIEHMGFNRIVMARRNDAMVETFEWDGTDWSAIGTQLNIPTLGHPSIARLDSTTIGLSDHVLDEIRTLESNTSCTLPTGSAGDIVFNQYHSVMQFCNGSSWIAMDSDNLSDGLVGHWKLDETSGTTAYDSSVFGRNGTFTNGNFSTNTTSGIIRNAINLDSNPPSSPIISIPGSSDFDLNDFTLSAWIKFDSTDENGQTNHRIISSQSSGLFQLRIVHSGSDRLVQVEVRDVGGGTVHNLNSSIDINDGEWHHVLATRSGNDFSVYIDGALDTTNSRVLGKIITGTEVRIGAFVPASQHFPGGIDDVRIYNRALSAFEIEQLYKYSLDKSPMVHWPLDEKTGTTALDAVGDTDASMEGGLDASNDSVPGAIGSALDFDGNDYILTGFNPVFSATDDFTFSMWFKRDTYSTTPGVSDDDESIFGLNTCNTQFIRAEIDADANTCTLNEIDIIIQDDSGANDTLCTTTAFEDTDWHHLAIVYDDDTDIYVYVDGVLDTSEGSAPTASDGFNFLSSPALSFMIGASNDCGGLAQQEFKGPIDDFRVFRRALTAAEIQTLVTPCENPSGRTGDMVYNDDEDAMQYCNGSGWIAIGK